MENSTISAYSLTAEPKWIIFPQKQSMNPGTYARQNVIRDTTDARRSPHPMDGDKLVIRGYLQPLKK